MKIGIIVAMSKELALLLHNIEDESRVTVNNRNFYIGRIGRHEVVLAQCGIGKVNAAVGTLTLIENFHPSLIINTGVAGGTGTGARVMDIVAATAVAYHDVWCGPDTEWGQAADCPPQFDCPLPDDAFRDMDVKRGLIASGDIFVSDAATVERIRSLYPEAVAVDMESAAVAQVCHLKDVPCVVLRVVSDTPGATDDNMTQYTNFWDAAPGCTFDAVNTLLSNL